MSDIHPDWLDASEKYGGYLGMKVWQRFECSIEECGELFNQGVKELDGDQGPYCPKHGNEKVKEELGKNHPSFSKQNRQPEESN